MPHIIVEHSGSDPAEVKGLVEGLHAVAASIAAFPVGGLRVRSYRCEHAIVGNGDDGGPAKHFVYVTVRMGEGRPEAVKRDIGDRLFAVVEDWAQDRLSQDLPTSLGLEIQDIEKDWTWKTNNIHALLKGNHDG